MYENLRNTIEGAEQALAHYNSLIPRESLLRAAETMRAATRAMEPSLKILQDPAFQRQLMEIGNAMTLVADEVRKHHALTLPAIQTLERLYGTVDTAAVKISETESVPEEKREELITRPFFSDVKQQIRRSIPSVKEILPLALPKETQWEDIEIRFIDSQTIFIQIPRLNAKITVDYTDMGMWDARSKRPNAQWTIFQNLAKYGGEISWKTPVAGHSIKKQKQLLSEALRRYFNIESDPFLLYQKEKAYRLKLTLIPYVPEATDDRTESQTYFDEKTPLIHDPYEHAPDPE